MAESHDGPVSPRRWERVVRQNPTHHILVDFKAEGVRNLLGNARAAKARIEAMTLSSASKRQRVDEVKVLRKDMAAEHFAHVGAAS
jgi:hypothetical protein